MKLKLNALLVVASITFAGSSAFAQASSWKDSYGHESGGRYAQAAEAMEQVLREAPGHSFALMRRGWLNYLQGRYAEALRDYDNVLLRNPNALEARLGITLPLMAQKRWSEAAAEARKVLAVNAWDYTAHTRLLACEEAERQWDELARHANALAVRYPSDATVLVYLARAELARGNAKGARSAYAQVLERAPTNAEALGYFSKST